MGALRSQTIKQATTLLAITALLSNVFGFARNLIFYRLIPTDQLDIYFASFRIPDFVFNLLILGAVTSAVIPVVSGLVAHKNEEEAWRTINQLLSWASLLLVVLIGLLMLFMRPLVEFLVPGFDPPRLEATVLASRVILLQMLLFSWSYLLGALLNSYRRFFSYALAPLVYNLSLITGGFFAAHYGLTALIYSVVVGAFLHFFLQCIEAYRLGFRPRLIFGGSPQLKEIINLMIPRSISQGVNQAVYIVYTRLASTLQAGSIAIFWGINDLQTTPVVIVANSMAVAMLPTFSAQIASEKWQELNVLLTKIIRTSLFILLPLVALGFVLRAQVVRLYFGIGGADWTLTTLAIQTFSWFLIGIVPAALVVILARVFYASKDTYTPMVVASIASLIGITVTVVGIRVFHANVTILAISESLIVSIQALLFMYILQRRGHIKIFGSDISSSLLTYLFGALLAAIATWITLHLVDTAYTHLGLTTARVAGLFLQTLLATLVGAAVYLGYSKLSSKEEMQWLKGNRFLSKK